VAWLCRRYKVSRSGFYAWLARAGGKRRRNDEELGARIERIYRDSGFSQLGSRYTASSRHVRMLLYGHYRIACLVKDAAAAAMAYSCGPRRTSPR
jgi:hypothetical protein